MIKIIAVGKVKEKFITAAIEEYLKRLSAYDKVEISEIPDEKIPEKASEKKEEKIKELEGDKILKKVKDNDFLIALDLKGREFDSLSFASYLDQVRTYKSSSVAFAIGGSLGLSSKVLQRADCNWKLSNLTFPHQLCRLILIEQIYRAFKINNNEIYHK